MKLNDWNVFVAARNDLQKLNSLSASNHDFAKIKIFGYFYLSRILARPKNMQEILVKKENIATTKVAVDESPIMVNSNEICIEVKKFGLSTNNITYAVFGDAMQYWGYFPRGNGYGCVPVWGIGEIVETRLSELNEGEKIFGYFPMASHFKLAPKIDGDFCFTDTSEHRQQLHSWYNRYYKCSSDPLFSESSSEAQILLWALFMTGWKLAETLRAKADTIIISSASSKTSTALAWALSRMTLRKQIIGLTSEKNISFVKSTNLFDVVVPYSNIDFDKTAGATAFVDVAGNHEVSAQIHRTYGDDLGHSVFLGATHRAMATDEGSLPGPAPELFFIPDEAEAAAKETGFKNFHLDFAKEWATYVPWASGWLDITHAHGIKEIEKGYLRMFSGDFSPNQATIYSWI